MRTTCPCVVRTYKPTRDRFESNNGAFEKAHLRKQWMRYLTGTPEAALDHGDAARVRLAVHCNAIGFSSLLCRVRYGGRSEVLLTQSVHHGAAALTHAAGSTTRPMADTARRSLPELRPRGRNRIGARLL